MLELALVEPGHGGELAAHAADALQRQMQRVNAARRVESGETRARLERIADETLAFDREPAHEFRARERGGGRQLVARFEFEREVAGYVGVQLRRAGRDRGIEGRDGGQIAIFDVDEIARVFRDCRGLRNDHRHRLAHEAHASLGQHRMQRLHHLLPVLARVVDYVGQRLESLGARVVAGQNRGDARMRQRARRVDADDLGVGAVGAQKKRVQLVRKVPVRRIAAVAGGEAMIFAARHGG